MTTTSTEIHPELQAAQELVYAPSGFSCENIHKEAESVEYAAHDLQLNKRRIKFRVAKITPTKIGQFVTLWKRIGKGPIMPHDLADPVDFFVVTVRHDEKWGQFIFPKMVLVEQGIVSKDGKGGKRAMRVYPAWDKTDSRQAKRTQDWQLKYFFELKLNAAVDVQSVQRLLAL